MDKVFEIYWAKASLKRSKAGIYGLEGGRDGVEGNWIEVMLDMVRSEMERESKGGGVKRVGRSSTGDGRR